jgi:hypothetical protein
MRQVVERDDLPPLWEVSGGSATWKMMVKMMVTVTTADHFIGGVWIRIESGE